MNNLSKEKKSQLLLVVIVTLAVLGVLWFFLISAQQTNLEGMAKKTKEAKDKVELAENTLKKAEAVEAELQEKGKELSAAEAQMASGDLYSWIITTVNRFIAEQNVSIPAFSREVIGNVGVFPKFPYQAATFQLRGTAYFHDFGKFLADFENGFPYMRVQNLEIIPVSNQEEVDREKIEFRFEIVALIKPNGA